ncbi:MAG TPA: DUF6321 domain-containing protein [Edaphobacter sp.]|nr:DUF6321 domain-containing protein [Edaphobacter sp.]
MSTAKTTAKKGAKKTARPSRKTATKKSRSVASASVPAAGRDPKGGLTAKGREFYRKTEGSNLKPGVKGKADTPEKMRRKGSFLTRHFTHPRGPMVKDGEPTRLALSAHAWGEPVPKTMASARKLAAKGRALLKKYHETKEKAATAKKKSRTKQA